MCDVPGAVLELADLALGRHVLEVAAEDVAGIVATTSASLQRGVPSSVEHVPTAAAALLMADAAAVRAGLD